MTSLAADVASLATGLGAVTGDVARLVAVVAALHRKAAGVVAALRAAACHVTSLVAIVTTQLRSLSKNSLSPTYAIIANPIRPKSSMGPTPRLHDSLTMYVY